MSRTAEGPLVDGLRRGDAEAAERIVSRYGEGAYRLAVRITQNAEDAGEIVEDAFWGAMDNIDTFGGDAALGSWLYRVVVTAALRKIRRPAVEHAALDLAEERAVPPDRRDDWSERLDDPALARALRATLSAAIDDLPADYRAVVLLRDANGLSMAEIARVMHTSLADAKSMLHRARLALRNRLAAFMATAVRP
jgi:RNA polymerase sigma-70 factor, ECF subfamily